MVPGGQPVKTMLEHHVVDGLCHVLAKPDSHQPTALIAICAHQSGGYGLHVRITVGSAMNLGAAYDADMEWLESFMAGHIVSVLLPEYA
jgi:hypothetical protein